MDLRPPGDQDQVLARLRGPLAADDPRVLDILRRHYLTPPSTRPYNLSTDPLYKFAISNDDNTFLTINIEKLFGDQHGGFFVEAGAYDGERVSNTLRLEKELGWTGLLIEPNHESYSKLTTKHRKAWTSNTCLSTENHPKEQVLVSLVKRLNSELSLQERMAAHRRIGSYLLGVKLNNTAYDRFIDTSDKSYSVVQCFPLASYLLALKVSTVDFLSLDIQGAEKSVLKNFPWDRITIRAMVVEEVHFKDFNHQFVDDMKNRGFVLVAKEGIDYIFVKTNDTLMKKVKPLPTQHKH
ncbi:protein Star-like [Procambarus clarkii]|uniref:protein Star-like n=1 Tax=Procambarus clarkii TaxID=6728 RepID=UPI003744970A